MIDAIFKRLNKMSYKRIFNTAKKHLLEQQKAAIGINGLCAYRGKDNTMCAVGCLIPNELYDSTIEGYGMFKLRERSSVPISDKKYNFLRGLQIIHDSTDPVRWASALDDLEKTL